MPPDYFELPPIDKRPKPDFSVWLNVRQYFLDQRAELIKIRETEGKTAAEMAHEEMMEGIEIEDIDAWERLFAEGKWQYPHAQEMVEEARTSLARFLGDILPPHEEAMRELRIIKTDLLDALTQLKNGGQNKSPVNLAEIFKKVEHFRALSSSPEETQPIINEIMSLVSQVAQNLNKTSNF